MPLNAESGFRQETAALAIIYDCDIEKPLGAAFACLRTNWFVTAAHVLRESDDRHRPNLILKDGRGRDRQIIQILDHPEHVDLSIAVVEDNVDEFVPWFPQSHGLLDDNELAFLGYSPTKSQEVGRISMNTCMIPSFQIEKRQRSNTEYVIIFEHDHPEPGCSGGPVYTISGGGVVGVMIQLADEQCRATSILSFINALVLPETWTQTPYPLGSAKSEC